MYGCEGAYGAGDAEDDLYSGYNQPEPPRVLGASAGNSLGNSLGSSLGNSLGHSLGGGWRAPLSHAPMRASIASRGTVSRLGLAPPLAESARPLTAVSAAGYSSASRRPPSSGFEAPRMIHSTPRGPAPPLRRRADDSPAEKARESEKQIGALVERSAVLAAGGEHAHAIDVAKEASTAERRLRKERETNRLEAHDAELTYTVALNLANQYHASGFHAEALETHPHPPARADAALTPAPPRNAIDGPLP